MTDLEITRLCAKSMGYSHVERKGDGVHDADGRTVAVVYWPLTDDAQCFALVKQLKICIAWGELGVFAEPYNPYLGEWFKTPHETVNRAVCECVAKMQAAK